MKLSKLQNDYPEYFQFFENLIEVVEMLKIAPSASERKGVEFKKINSQRTISYPFYKHISRIAKNKLR